MQKISPNRKIISAFFSEHAESNEKDLRIPWLLFIVRSQGRSQDFVMKKIFSITQAFRPVSITEAFFLKIVLQYI